MSDEPKPLTGPSGLYFPKEVTPLCEATKDLLLWMRNQKFRCDHLEVTDKGVLMHGLADNDPLSAAGKSGTPPDLGLGYDGDFPPG